VALRELGLQGVSARPLAILPILPGSIAPARAPTPRRAKLSFGWVLNDGASPFRCVATFVMPRCEPIPALEHRPRISESHRGRLDRFLLATLIRYRARLQHRDITVARGCRTPKSRAHVTTRLGERGPVPGAQAGAILPGSIGSIARGCAEGIGARSTRAPISIRAEI